MKDPRTVSQEEKERTIKLGRQIFANLLRAYGILPESLQEFSRNIEYLSQRPQAAPKAEPEPPQEPQAKTLETALTLEDAIRELRASERRR